MIGHRRSPGNSGMVPRMAAAMLMVIFVAGCASAPSRSFQADMRFVEAADPYPVVLSDETGLVTRIDGGPFNLNAEFGEPAIQSDPTDPNAFFVTWGSGPVHDATLSFKPFQDGYLMRLELHANGGVLGGGGTMELRPGVVRVVTSRPVPLDSIQVGGSANT